MAKPTSELRSIAWPWLAATLAALVSACTIGTPMRVMPPGPTSSPDDRLQVSLTHAAIDPGRREAFDRQVRLVFDGLSGQAGLAAFAVRRGLLGREVWTITVWENEAARARFYASDRHRDAMREAGDAILHIRTQRFELRRADLPIDWKRALEVLGPPPWDAGGR